MKPLPQRLNVSHLPHLEGRKKDSGRERGESEIKLRRWRGGREAKRPLVSKEILEKVRMIMPKYRVSVCV